VTKLIDWAFCKRTYTNLKINKISCGTLQFQAPEIELKMKYNCKVDIWAFGAVIYELITGKQFYHKERPKDFKKNFKEII
jgi:serine/threonine protein kinase